MDDALEALRTPNPAPATTVGLKPSGERWAYEWKWDDVRGVVAASVSELRVYSRNGRDVTSTYPEIAAIDELVDRTVLLDGEVVTLDKAVRAGSLAWRADHQDSSGG